MQWSNEIIALWEDFEQGEGINKHEERIVPVPLKSRDRFKLTFRNWLSELLERTAHHNCPQAEPKDVLRVWNVSPVWIY